MPSEGFRPVLEPILRSAGDLALQYFGQVTAEWKRDGSVVTRADRAVEDFLVDQLKRRFRGYAIVSEEGGHADGDQGTWHVDPIDGTSSFLEGLAHWGPTLCLVRDDQLVVGAFWQPRLKEFWFAERGAGAWRCDVRLKASDLARPQREQTLCAPSRFHLAGPVPWPGKVRALGSSAAHLALVASGSAAVAVVPEWALWDVGCGALLLEESGYSLFDAKGDPVDVARCPPGLPLVAGGPNAVQHLIRDGWAERVLSPVRLMRRGGDE